MFSEPLPNGVLIITFLLFIVLIVIGVVFVNKFKENK